MKLHILSLLLLSIIFGLHGCKKSEGVLTPSNIVDTYNVSQGNNAFDETIVNYYQKYGTYLLYQFSEKDAYWTPTGWKKPILLASGAYQAGAEVAPSDPTYVPAQLALIQSKWFSFYSDKFLKKFLPLKILLCSKVDTITSSSSGNPIVYTKNVRKIATFYNYDNIQVNYGDATVNTMTTTEIRQFIYRANLNLMQSIFARGLSLPSPEFINSADYITAMTTTTQSYGKGIITIPSGASAQLDWNAYITAMVTYSTVQLNASVLITDTSAAGILNTTKDTSGQIKKRYNIVRNYFINEYGVDLQLIGNATRGI